MRPALIGSISVFLAGQGLAAQWQDPSAIRATVERFAEQAFAGRSGVKISTIGVDARIRLPQCTAPLDAAAPRGLGRGQGVVNVRCSSPAWQLYVPVRASFVVNTVVARHALRRGQRISADDLSVEQRDSAGLPANYLSRPELAIGLTLRRSIRPGAIINPGALEAPRAIRRGELVTLIAEGPGISVKSEGTALEDAVVDQRISVKTRSGRTVEGTVATGNRVYVRGKASEPGQ